eukprot:Gb_28634 [translate_table: standard]
MEFLQRSKGHKNCARKASDSSRQNKTPRLQPRLDSHLKSPTIFLQAPELWKRSSKASENVQLVLSVLLSERLTGSIHSVLSEREFVKPPLSSCIILRRRVTVGLSPTGRANVHRLFDMHHLEKSEISIKPMPPIEPKKDRCAQVGLMLVAIRPVQDLSSKLWMIGSWWLPMGADGCPLDELR